MMSLDTVETDPLAGCCCRVVFRSRGFRRLFGDRFPAAVGGEGGVESCKLKVESFKFQVAGFEFQVGG